MSKALTTATTDDHPAMKLDTQAVFQHKSSKLAEYWKGMIDNGYVPLSIEDTIWGNRTIPPMDLDTPTGAVFQMLFSGKTKKKDLFGAQSKFIGEAGQFSGLAARIYQVNPLDLYTHSASNRLTLCITAACHTQSIHNMMSNVTKVRIFFHTPIRQLLLEKIIEKFCNHALTIKS